MRGSTRQPRLSHTSMLILAFLLSTADSAIIAQGVPARTLAAIDCAAQTPNGALLLRPHSVLGTAAPGLIVADPATGSDIGRIDLPVVDAAFATGVAGHALAIAGDRLYLVDTEHLSASAISLAGESATDLTPNPVQFRGTAGTRFLLLGSPSFDRTYLVDAEAGIATNLSALLPTSTPDAPVFIPFAAVTPDDAHVVMWDGRHVYLAPTAPPIVAKRVDQGAFAFAPDFSPDGQDLIFSESAGPGSGSALVVQSIDGAVRQVVRASDFAMVTLWVPRSRLILVDERTEQGAAAGKVFTIDLDTGLETPVLSYGGSLTVVQLNPTGTRALLGVEHLTGGVWHIVDFTTGTVEELPLLAGGRALPGLYADSRWSLLVPLLDDNDPLSGPAYRGIDLDTGAVGRLLERPPGMTFIQAPVLSADGRKSLVIGQTETRQTLWLLDAAELRTTMLAEGDRVNGMFSPDGCFVAVTTETSVDGTSISSVVIHPGFGNESPPMPTLKSGSELLAWIADDAPAGSGSVAGGDPVK